MPEAASGKRAAAVGDAVRWLLESGVRTPDGGFRSIYRPSADHWITYGGGLSCLQCTAGGVRALLAAAAGPAGAGVDASRCRAAALESAAHMLELMRSGGDGEDGRLPCGRNAGTVKVLHTEAAIRAFLDVHEATGDARWLDGARRAALWTVRRLQRADGSLRSGAGLSARSRVKQALREVAPLGAASFVGTFHRLSRLTGDATLDAAASRLGTWLARQQDAQGGFPMYRYRALNRVTAPFYNGGPSELWSGCIRYHPAPNAWMLEVLALRGEAEAAGRLSLWIEARLGPNGLLYQYYFPRRMGQEARGRGASAAGGIVAEPYGARSVEEDVMPTAAVGLQWLARSDLAPAGRAEALLRRIADGCVHAQVRDGAPAVMGGVRGLPLHPEFDADIYTWDTAWAVLYLTAWLRAAA